MGELTQENVNSQLLVAKPLTAPVTKPHAATPKLVFPKGYLNTTSDTAFLLELDI